MACSLTINPASFAALLLGLAATHTFAQGTAPAATPRSSLLAPSAPANARPPREVPLVEKKLTELSHQEFSEDGTKALEINPAKWRHAETENFILHFRRVTEAQKVAREVEYNLWFIATTLGASKERYAKKSHVYVFEDGDEWGEFLSVSNIKMTWAASFARGDELFLNVRGAGRATGFDSQLLAHETTHAVVARLFPRTRWPLWLNEGFAEYMGSASVAARKGQTVKRHQAQLRLAEMPLSKLEYLTEYPDDMDEIGQLYQSSEKFIRFLTTEFPKERIVKFIDAVLAGGRMNDAVLAVYGDKVKDWADFEKRYARFQK